MDNDDRQIGRILGRREVLGLLGAAGGAALLVPRIGLAAPSARRPSAEVVDASTPMFAQDVPSCVVRPELTEGPYFVDDQLNRSDIRVEPSTGSTSPGVPVTLTFNVSQIAAGSCAPLARAQVDVWQCDALGVYSGVTDTSFPSSTVGETFLRGYQLTDDNGVASFATIYPGWYRGRAVHIHFKIRSVASTGAAYEFTSQFFFDDALSDQVHSLEPYASKGQRDMRNASDGIYRSGGDQLLLNAVATDDGGYAASFPIGLDLSDLAVGAADGGGGAGGSGGGRGFPPPGPPRSGR
jgi:protocatechuate 3,4-dioxygenase beta subunit